MGTKMGMHNRITEERYQHIKQEWAKVQNGAHNDDYIAKMCGISRSTAGLVRRTSSYHEYRLKTDKRLRKPIVVIAQRSGLPYEDFGKKPIFSSKPLEQNEQNNTMDANSSYRATNKTAVMACVVSVGWAIFLLFFFVSVLLVLLLMQ